jgi:hypothetical protein
MIRQCELRCFGGKCLVAQFFALVALEWCTVGGSAGSRAPDHHMKLQVGDRAANFGRSFDRRNARGGRVLFCVRWWKTRGAGGLTGRGHGRSGGPG